MSGNNFLFKIIVALDMVWANEFRISLTSQFLDT